MIAISLEYNGIRDLFCAKLNEIRIVFEAIQIINFKEFKFFAFWLRRRKIKF